MFRSRSLEEKIVFGWRKTVYSQKNSYIYIYIYIYNFESNPEGSFNQVTIKSRSRDSIVGIATGYGLVDRGVGVRVPVGSRILSTSSRPALGSIQPPIQWG
jgi:hypothetical protein